MGKSQFVVCGAAMMTNFLISGILPSMRQPSIFKKIEPIQAMNLLGVNPFVSTSFSNYFVEAKHFSPLIFC